MPKEFTPRCSTQKVRPGLEVCQPAARPADCTAAALRIQPQMRCKAPHSRPQRPRPRQCLAAPPPARGRESPPCAATQSRTFRRASLHRNTRSPSHHTVEARPNWRCAAPLGWSVSRIFLSGPPGGKRLGHHVSRGVAIDQHLEGS